MTKSIFVSWQEQLDEMQYYAEATGVVCYEELREILADHIRHKHGKFIDIEYEVIPKIRLNAFIEWLYEDE